MNIENKNDLMQKITDLKKKLFSLKFKKSSGELANMSEISKIKKEIARLFTKINMQE